jgi:hypothetical protein
VPAGIAVERTAANIAPHTSAAVLQSYALDFRLEKLLAAGFKLARGVDSEIIGALEFCLALNGQRSTMNRRTDPSAKPRVSVLMTVYDAAPYLEKSIDGLIAQSFSPWELIAVENGSKDESAAILLRYRDPRIRVIQLESNIGRTPAEGRRENREEVAIARVRYAAALVRSGRLFRGVKEACVALAVDPVSLCSSRITRGLLFR